MKGLKSQEYQLAKEEVVKLQAQIDAKRIEQIERISGTQSRQLTALEKVFLWGGLMSVVLLDVVFNHTAEGDALGPTLSLRGLDNAVYYRHARQEPGALVNDTGCGNTLACDRAPVVRLMMDSMRYFVERAGVDGFRFDLATIMGRTDEGFSVEAPLLTAMRQDPVLAQTLLIAEPWDVGPGGYQLGAFPSPFMEWNDRWRDDVRRFWRGDHGMLGAFATRISGSQDIFGPSRRPPSASPARRLACCSSWDEAVSCRSASA